GGQLPRGDGGGDERPDDVSIGLLDAPGQCDLALAGEERDPAQLPVVGPDRVFVGRYLGGDGGRRRRKRFLQDFSSRHFGVAARATGPGTRTLLLEPPSGFRARSLDNSPLSSARGSSG